MTWTKEALEAIVKEFEAKAARDEATIAELRHSLEVGQEKIDFAQKKLKEEEDRSSAFLNTANERNAIINEQRKLLGEWRGKLAAASLPPEYVSANMRTDEHEQRISALEADMGKLVRDTIRNVEECDKRIDALDSLHVDLTPQHHVVDALRKAGSHDQRIAALEARFSSLRSTDKSAEEEIEALAKRIDAVEKHSEELLSWQENHEAEEAMQPAPEKPIRRLWCASCEKAIEQCTCKQPPAPEKPQNQLLHDQPPDIRIASQADVHALGAKIDALAEKASGSRIRINELDSLVDTVRQEMHAKLDALQADLATGIKELRAEKNYLFSDRYMHEKLDALVAKVEGMRAPIMLNPIMPPPMVPQDPFKSPFTCDVIPPQVSTTLPKETQA